MAKKKSKAAEIRAYIEANPEASNTEVIAALKKRRITASSAEISTNRKKVEKPSPKKSTGRRKKAVRRTKRSTPETPTLTATLPELLAAKALLKTIGDAERACALVKFVDELSK